MQIDHIVIAAADLETAKLEFFETTGVMPADGGPHPGGGTRNALVSFSDNCYLEIIAPDPEQELEGTNGERFAALAQSEILHWAVRVSDLDAVSAQLIGALQQSPAKPGPVYDMSRNTPTGERLKWRLMGVQRHEWGGLVPFFIDWQNTPHPSESAPVVGPLKKLQLGLPTGVPEQALAEFLGAIVEPQFELLVAGADGVGLALQFDSSRGTHAYAAKAPVGFSF